MIDLADELIQEYVDDSRDRLCRVETDLLAIEEGGKLLNEERLGRALEAVQSVIRGAVYFELTRIRELAQQTERVLGLVRSRHLTPSPERIRVLFGALDRLQELIREPGESHAADISESMAALIRVCAEAPLPAAALSRPLRTLLVEDDFTSRLVLQTFLSRYGDCHIAVNGREAVEAFRGALDKGLPYDLVCMDIMMPVMDGREAVRQVRALEEARGILSTSGVKIIMTTAVEDIKEVIQCFRELCDAYLTKPIDLAKFLSYLKSYQLVE